MKTKIIPVMFHGERDSFMNGIRQLFKDREGQPVMFTGIKGVHFGDVVELSLNADGAKQMSVRPKHVEIDWAPTDEERAEFEVQKLIVTGARQRRLAGMKLKKPHAHIVRAAELLRPFYKGMTDIDRRRFMEWFANEVSRTSRKR